MEPQNQIPPTENQNNNSQMPEAPPVSYSQPAVSELPHKSKKTLILIFALFFLLVGVGAAYWLMRKPANVVVNNQTKSSESEEAKTPEAEIESQVSDIKMTVQPSTKQFTVKSEGAGVQFTPEGKEYDLEFRADKKASLTISTPYEAGQNGTEYEAVMKGVLGDIRQKLRSFGYTETARPIHYDDNGEAYNFTNGKALCDMEYTAVYISLGCMTSAKVAEQEQQVKPLIDAFIAAHPSSSLGDTIFGHSEIVNSPVQGYRRASMGVGGKVGGGAMALFYEVGSKWSYLTGGQEPPECSFVEKNVDAAKAMVGTDCYRSEAEPSSKVKAPN